MGRKLGIKAIKKALTNCALDPEKSVWFKFAAVADNSYCLQRAVELLMEAHAGNKDKIRDAIALLGLLKARGDEGICQRDSSTSERPG